MPRGIKNPIKTIENEIAEIDERIAAYQVKISSLAMKRNELMESKEKAELDALYQFIKQSGKTPKEFMSQLSMGTT